LREFLTVGDRIAIMGTASGTFRVVWVRVRVRVRVGIRFRGPFRVRV
jgi:hypothetical protein